MIMQIEQSKNSFLNQKKLSFWKIVKYLNFVFGTIILICLLVFVLFTDRLINKFLKDPITNAFTEAYPEYSLLLGEIFYRLGSNILDDRTTGAGRLFRELAVAILTPTRFFGRFLNGDISRSTPEEVYQKEPLNVTLSAGYHKVNEGTIIEKGMHSANFNVHLDYGNPFEKRSRKPYDYFKIRTDFDFGVGR